MDLKGIGKSTKNVLTRMTKDTPGDDKKPKNVETKQNLKIYSAPPAIATKSVMVQDLFNVSDLVNICTRSHGFELSDANLTTNHCGLGCSTTQ